MQAYHINQVLSEIARSGNQAFRIRFVKSTRKEAGQIKEAICYYGAPNPKDRTARPKSATSRAPRKLYTDSGSLPLTECSTGRLLTPIISHIIGFQGRKVYH